MRPGLSSILTKLTTILGGLLVVGLLLRLLGLVLQPVLPAFLMQVLSGGWSLLLSLIGPALVPLAAVGLVVAGVWLFVGRRR